MRTFIELPYSLYRNDPVWVPPLRSEERLQFDPKHNPFLDHCEWELFLLEDEGRTVGRIAAFMDTLAIDFWQERIGLLPAQRALDGHVQPVKDMIESFRRGNSELHDLLVHEIRATYG